MTELPASWATVSVAEVAEVISGQAPPGTSYNKNGDGLPLYQGKTDFGDVHLGPPRLWTAKPTKRARADDVLLSVRAPVGPTNLAREECAIGRGLAAIRGYGGISQSYLLYAIRATVKQLEEQATGTTFSAIGSSVVRDHILPIAPAAEQERIVAVIEEQFSRLDAGVTALERIRQNLKRMRDAVLRAAITGALVNDDASRWDMRQLAALGVSIAGSPVTGRATIPCSTGVRFRLSKQATWRQLTPGSISILRRIVRLG